MLLQLISNFDVGCALAYSPPSVLSFRYGSNSPSILFLHDSKSEATLFCDALANLENRGISSAALDIAHPPKFHEILDAETVEILQQTVARQINSLDSFPLDIVSDFTYFLKVLILHALFNQRFFTALQVGHGCGSVVALKLALMYPDKIRKLVLWGVPLPSGKDIRDCPPVSFLSFHGSRNCWFVMVKGFNLYHARPKTKH